MSYTHSGNEENILFTCLFVKTVVTCALILYEPISFSLVELKVDFYWMTLSTSSR